MMLWPFVGRRERLRREASDWIARLNGAYDQRDRAAFEQWYRADPDHAATYDRLASLFSAAEHIRPALSVGEARPAPARDTQRLRSRYALSALAATVIAIILGYAVLGAREIAPSARHDVQVAVFVATESRLVSLADGSKILLSPGSELDVDFDGESRRLRLRRGEGRFTVAHEARPFVVTAAGAEVVARGTQFVVSLTPGGTLVSLIEGRVEVSYASTTDRGKRRVAGLEPGQRLMVPAATPSALATDAAATGAPDPMMIELEDTRLAEALELVNRQSERKVRLADPALADLRVTGAFRAGDIAGFTHGVAAALDLEIKRAADGTLWLGEHDQPRG